MKVQLTSAAVVALSLGTAVPASAAPMSPTAYNVAQFFSATVQDAFTLLADTDNKKLVYYVPRRGGIAVQSPKSSSPIPRFQVSAYTPSYGFFAGQELSNLGGSFSTTSDLGALKQLQAEASRQGYSIAPAPASKAQTKFLIAGYEPPNGRIEVECITETLQVTGSDGVTRQIKVPKCKTRQSPADLYELDTNVMYKFTSQSASGGSVVAQEVPFQGVTLPGWAPQLRTFMNTGAQWDNILSSKVDWEIKTSELTRQARFNVNWTSLFEQASTFAAYHRNSCVDVEVRGFFERLVQCSAENQCGIRIEYLQSDGSTWGPKAPNDANFINVVNATQKRLQDELFNEVRKYTRPVNGQVSNQTRSVFTLRANYEKRILNKNEVIYLQYNPGPTDFNTSTMLNVTCLKGGFEEGRVSWNMADSGCRALLGQ